MHTNAKSRTGAARAFAINKAEPDEERSMSTAIIVAIVALMATIVGATIGAATNYALAVRRDHADEERDRRNHAIEVKRAARLIDAELHRAQTAAEICVEKRHWWSADVPQLTTEAWQKYDAILAPDLSDQAWLDLRVALEAVDNIRRFREITVDTGLVANAISDATAEQIVPVLRDIKSGRNALAPFVFDSLHAGR